jgi:hypothetical protein
MAERIDELAYDVVSGDCWVVLGQENVKTKNDKLHDTLVRIVGETYRDLLGEVPFKVKMRIDEEKDATLVCTTPNMLAMNAQGMTQTPEMMFRLYDLDRGMRQDYEKTVKNLESNDGVEVGSRILEEKGISYIIFKQKRDHTNDTMQPLQVRIMDYRDAWTRDKELLRKYVEPVDIDWDMEFPQDEDARSVYLLHCARVKNPHQPIELTTRYLEESVQRLIPEIEQMYSAHFKEIPTVEIVRPDQYLARVNEIERAVNAQFGYGDVSYQIPTIFSSAEHGSIVFPSRFVTADAVEFQWGKAWFEVLLSDALAQMLFRQLRGEWKDDFHTALKQVGPSLGEMIKSHNRTIKQHVLEELALATHPEWAPHVAADKIPMVWQNTDGMETYRAIGALRQVRTFGQIAMADFTTVIEQDIVTATFIPTHPNNRMKKLKFNQPF